MKFKFLVLLFVAVTAVKGQIQDVNDYEDSLWSNEANDDQLELGKPLENSENSDQVDEQFYDDVFEEPLNEEDETQLKNIEEEDTLGLEDINLFADQENEEKEEIDLNEQLHDTNNKEDTNFFDTVNSFSSEEVQKQLDEADAEANETEESKDTQAVSEETKQVLESSIETKDNLDGKIDNLDDYQIEDNRSQGKEINKVEINDNYDNFDAIDEPEDQNTNIEADLTDTVELNDSELIETVDKPELQNENLDQLSEETKQLLEEENSPSEEDFDNVQKSVIAVPENINESELAEQNDDTKSDEDKDQFFADVIENQQNEEIHDFVDENKSLFATNEENAADLDKSFKYEHDMIVPEENIAFDNPDDDANDRFKELASEFNTDDDSDEDTVDKVYEDLNADLAKLFETMDKFNDNSDETVEGVVDKYEEQFNKPYGEDTILSQRQDYDNYGDLNDGSNLADIFDTSDLAEDNEEENNKIEKQTFDLADNAKSESVDQPNPETGLKNADETQPRTTLKEIDVEDLEPAQYNDLMVQFAATHVEDIDSLREDFGKNIAAVHITLTDTEITEITSPNYPNTYPTNNVIDWILEGDGTGIELNVTDLELRGIQDDFLLIKPGGADDTGHDGLVFSYHLNEPRLYRFTDVSKVFVRFQSGAGLGFLKGFRITVKMIWPPETEDSGEVPPAPAPLLPAPPSVLTVTLGGVSQKDFFAIKDEFQRLVADMATMYIFANDIEIGDNTTHEVTQLTSIAYCNVNWPNSEQCVEVTLGVPLVYGDEAPTRLNGADLRNMWETYSLQDPFAVRLRQMGITEFAVPDDGKVLMLWLALASAVILSAAVLAFALWRYSCIEDYTRMKSFSDTDSISEVKRGLDLYPTPHQTLPPLYADSDYKWADDKYDNSSRVDMGGFTNSSFARDELVDIDSDEEVVSPRDRNNTSFTPRDMYHV